MKATTGHRQKLPRLALRYSLLCDLSVRYEGHREALPIRLPDLSTRGMFINTSKRFPEGAVLAIRFRLPKTGLMVHARGEVRYWLEDVGVGVEFIDLDATSRRAIEQEIGDLRPAHL
jgi:hypothetical protein